MAAIKSGQLVRLSVQQLIDCIPGAGCSGGLYQPVDWLKWIQGNGGLCKESDYPYKAMKSDCHPCVPVPASNFSDIAVGDTETKLQAMVDVGPVEIVITVSQQFMSYMSGVFSGPCGQSLGAHVMLLVGYVDNAWILRNSWGTAWGERGYMRIKMGANVCDLADYTVSPIP